MRLGVAVPFPLRRESTLIDLFLSSVNCVKPFSIWGKEPELLKNQSGGEPLGKELSQVPRCQLLKTQPPVWRIRWGQEGGRGPECPLLACGLFYWQRRGRLPHLCICAHGAQADCCAGLWGHSNSGTECVWDFEGGSQGRIDSGSFPRI